MHGHRCQVCGFDFEQVYGQWGADFAEVHHLQELSTTDAEGVDTDPTRDLAVLCSKCHRMMHRKPKRALTLAELRSIVESARGTTREPDAV